MSRVCVFCCGNAALLVATLCLMPLQTQAQVATVQTPASEEATAQLRPAERPVGFSSFSLGASLVDYEESTQLSVAGRAVDVETDLSAIPTQSSNAFVAIDQRWGFYLFSVSTLGAPQSTEEWQVDEQVVRSNTVSFEQQKIGVLGSYRMRDGGRVLMGARYSKLEFKRFAAELAPAAADFGISEDSFPDGTVSETVWDIGFRAGYERSTLFGAGTRGWQHHWRITIGVPLISNVSNTEVNDGEVFRESLNGYSVGLDGLLGYRLSTNFLVGASVQIEVEQRYALDGDSEDLQSESTTAFPGNRTVSVIPAVGAYWSF